MNVIAFSALSSVSDIETIDLTSSAVELSIISVQDVTNITNDDNLLKIEGNADDSVSLVDGEWEQLSNSDGYLVYKAVDSNVTLLINEDIL